ncbi:hypothetical protein D3C81_933730 [compost metagenome]
MLAHRVHEDGAGHHQRFLVGQQHALAGTRGGQRRAQPGGADDRGHHGVGLRVGGDRLQFGFAVADFGSDTGVAQQRLQLRGRLGAAHHGPSRAERHALIGQLAHLPVRGQRMHGVAVGMAADDVERAFADRAGGTKDGNALHIRPLQRRLQRKISISAASGNTGSKASIRSSTPPWPGSSRLLSFMPTCRLSSDSNRSPITLAATSSVVSAAT